jgi:hypothetical protein
MSSPLTRFKNDGGSWNDYELRIWYASQFDETLLRRRCYLAPAVDDEPALRMPHACRPLLGGEVVLAIATKVKIKGERT